MKKWHINFDKKNSKIHCLGRDSSLRLRASRMSLYLYIGTSSQRGLKLPRLDNSERFRIIFITKYTMK